MDPKVFERVYESLCTRFCVERGRHWRFCKAEDGIVISGVICDEDVPTISQIQRLRADDSAVLHAARPPLLHHRTCVSIA